jgi:pyruvate/2-oxoglutarate/acetoin dehydrogenase E1 component
MRTGSDITLVGWGGQLHVMAKACDMAAKEGKAIE